MKKVFYFLCVLMLVMSTHVHAQMTTRVVKDGLFIPWEIIYGPDGKIWFDQKNGYICRVDPATGLTDTIYHEAANVIHGEGGMVGMALHPSFPGQPYVYVAYEYLQNANYWERIVRYTYDGTTLTNQIVLLDSITGNNNHNGCRLLIVQDKLFITTGDAEVGSNAQDLQSKNGKILRINLDGSIPSDNPIAGSPVFCWGQRNAQGLVFANTHLYSSMHGNTTDDEVNIISVGRNYGWPTVEGYCDQPAEMTFCTDSNVVEPIYAWSPTIAPSGIDFYNGTLFPAWQNSLLMCTLKDTTLHQLKLNVAHDVVTSDTRIPLHYGRLRDICISPDGKVYVSTSNSTASGTGSFIDKIIEIYDPSVSVNEVAAQTNKINIYPNPASAIITISATGIKDASYSVSNTLGQQLLSGTVAADMQNIDLAQLPAGLYVIKATTVSGQVWSGKIWKQ